MNWFCFCFRLATYGASLSSLETRSCFADTDECKEDPDICGPHTICRNVPGSYDCSCKEGFKSGEGELQCKGLDKGESSKGPSRTRHSAHERCKKQLLTQPVPFWRKECNSNEGFVDSVKLNSAVMDKIPQCPGLTWFNPPWPTSIRP